MDGGSRRILMDGRNLWTSRHVPVQDEGHRRMMKHVWQFEEPVGGLEINNIEPKNMPKYIKHDEWCQEWDDVEVRQWCSSDLIALFVSIAGSLPL